MLTLGRWNQVSRSLVAGSLGVLKLVLAHYLVGLDPVAVTETQSGAQAGACLVVGRVEAGNTLLSVAPWWSWGWCHLVRVESCPTNA